MKNAESLSDRSDFFYNDQRCAQSWKTSSFLNIIYTLAVKVSISYKLATLATELCRKEKTVNLNVKRKEFVPNLCQSVKWFIAIKIIAHQLENPVTFMCVF